MKPLVHFLVDQYNQYDQLSDEHRKVLTQFADWVNEYLQEQRPLAMTAYRGVLGVSLEGQQVPMYVTPGMAGAQIVDTGTRRRDESIQVDSAEF